MKLQTIMPLTNANTPLDYDSRVVLLGSCFAENIAAKMAYYQLQHLANPFGILYHPQAISRVVNWAVEKNTFDPSELVHHNERWHCLHAHSDLSKSSSQATTQNLNYALQSLRDNLENASHVIITLGTAWGYRHLNTGELVANCHKIPQNNFQKELASVTSITAYLTQLLRNVKTLNPKAIVVFTVSPVRHIKDGFQENQRSKAHLIAGVHSTVEASEEVHYFPSYEIMMDELRDYRFYDRDLIHPNALAIDYIWERFASVWLSSKAQPILEMVDELQKALAHKPFDATSASHQKFLESIARKRENLRKEIPHLNL